MAARVLIGGRWRRVSDAEAKYRRAKGQRVVGDRETGQPSAGDPKPLTVDAPVPTGAAVLETIVGAALRDGNGGMQGVDCDLCEESVEHVHDEAALVQAPATIIAPTELTDLELEMLTAPTPAPVEPPPAESTRRGRRRSARDED